MLLLFSLASTAQDSVRTVRVQAMALYKPDHRIFYRGVENPLTIEVSGVHPDSLLVTLNRGVIHGKAGAYTVVFPGDSAAEETTVSLYLSQLDTAGVAQLFDSLSFSLRTIAEPKVLLCGRSGGLISKPILLAGDSLLVIFPNCHLAKRGEVLSFRMEYYKGFLYYKFEQENGARFTERQHNAAKYMEEGSIFELNKIRVRCPDGVIRTAPPLSVEIGF